MLIYAFQQIILISTKDTQTVKNNRGNKNCLACKTNVNVVINCRFSKLRSRSLRFLACEVVSFSSLKGCKLILLLSVVTNLLCSGCANRLIGKDPDRQQNKRQVVDLNRLYLSATAGAKRYG